MEKNSTFYSEKIKLIDLTQNEFQAVAIMALENLCWHIITVRREIIIASTNNNDVNEEIVIRLIDTETAEISCSCPKDMDDSDRNELNVDSFIEAFNNAGIGIDEYMINKYLNKLNDLKIEAITAGLPKPTYKDRLLYTAKFFVPSKGYIITPILVYLNTVILIIMTTYGVSIFDPDINSLISWGGQYEPKVIGGEYYRLFTNFFIHDGILHLISNMFAFIIIGYFLERIIGTLRFAAAFVLCGIASSLTSMVFNGAVVAVGSSGAIFGVYGVFGALATTKFINKKTHKYMVSNISVFAAYCLISGLTEPGVDNLAHLGGLLSGFVIGFIYHFSLIKPGLPYLKYLTYPVLSAILLILVSWQILSLNKTARILNIKAAELSKNSDKALTFINDTINKPKEQLLIGIKDTGISYWNKNLTLLDYIKKNNKSLDRKNYYNCMTTYCEYRIKQYDIIYKKINFNTDEYDSLLNYYQSEIDSISDCMYE